MPRFFCSDISAENDVAVISGDDAKHIAGSLRMKPGEHLTVCDGKGTDCKCIIEQISPLNVCLKIIDVVPNQSEPSLAVSVFFAMPKGDKTEFIIQKSVELGASFIVPFISECCVSRPDTKDFEKKLLRYEKISEEAAKQCGRGIIPKVLPIMTFKQAVQTAVQSDTSMVLYEAEDQCSIKNVLSQKDFNTIAIMSGPEGGFSKEEIQYAQSCGLRSASLGKRILRCETAPLAALCAIMYHSGNLG